MIDDTDTYIVRDVLTDDIIFITPEDALNTSNGYDLVYDNEVNISYSLSRSFLMFPSNSLILMSCVMEYQ
jgi:hypothetical protein